MGEGMLSLSWNNHSTTFCHTLTTLRAKERYTDVTLACEGKFYPVHKLVLSTCSEYFENMFERTPCKHPVIVLSEIHRQELEALLSYMYAGYVNVSENNLARLIKVAELLEIKGLAVPDEPPNSNKKSASNQQAIDNRTSPVVRSRQSVSSSIEKSYSSTKPVHSLIDQVSPSPKRLRRESVTGSRENKAPSSIHTPPRNSQQIEVDSPSSEVCSVNDREDRRERVSLEPEPPADYPSTSQEPLIDKVQVTLEETLVKEEEIDDGDDRGGVSDTGGGGDDGSLLIPKFDPVVTEPPDVLSPPQPPTLHEAVIEALAGPSGIQGWGSGGNLGGRLTLGENYLSDGSQDVSSASLTQTPAQAHTVVRSVHGGHSPAKLRPPDPQWLLPNTQLSNNSYPSSHSFQSTNNVPKSVPYVPIGNNAYSCLYCPFQASCRSMLQSHINSHHSGEKPHACPFCPSRFAKKGNLKTHIRTHTGEKPYACPHCQYCCAHKSDLKKHINVHMRHSHVS